MYIFTKELHASHIKRSKNVSVPAFNTAATPNSLLKKNFSGYARKSDYSLDRAGKGIKQYCEDVNVILSTLYVCAQMFNLALQN